MANKFKPGDVVIGISYLTNGPDPIVLEIKRVDVQGTFPEIGDYYEVEHLFSHSERPFSYPRYYIDHAFSISEKHMSPVYRALIGLK